MQSGDSIYNLPTLTMDSPPASTPYMSIDYTENLNPEPLFGHNHRLTHQLDSKDGSRARVNKKV